MIVAVKTNSKKRLFIRIASLLAVVMMFVFYYFYMSNEFMSKQEDANQKIQTINKNSKIEKSKKLERIIYREIETAVDLIGQRNILDVKIISNRALIVVDSDTNLDALKVRYGSMALIKKGIKDTKIAIDLKYIIESKYNEK